MNSANKLSELDTGFFSSQAFRLEQSSVNTLMSTRRNPESQKAVELFLDS